MIKFFAATYRPDEMVKVVRNLPPEKWPEITEIVEVMKKATREQQRVTFKKIFEVFASRVHREISPDEQKAIWEAWSTYGSDAYSREVKERYILQRLDNEVMWLPEVLRAKVSKKSRGYQAFCKEFYEQKASEWREIPAEELENWIQESRQEFLEIITTL